MSCSKDKEIEIKDENTLENYSTNYSYETTTNGIGCGINGRFKVIPGEKYNYFLSTNLGNSNINWQVQSGLMTITSTNGKNAQVQFNSDFNTGIIRVTNINPNLGDCSVILEISSYKPNTL